MSVKMPLSHVGSALAVLLVSAPALADREGEARESLRAAQSILKEQATGESQLAAADMLRLIDAAMPATRLGATVGFKTDGESPNSSAEFGSISSGWRLGGAIPATDVALSTSTLENVNGNKVVTVSVRLPERVVAFGERSRSFEATLFLWKDGGATLRMRRPGTGLDRRSIDGGYERVERVYQLSRQGQPGTWSGLRYTVEGNGVMVLDPSPPSRPAVKAPPARTRFKTPRIGARSSSR